MKHKARYNEGDYVILRNDLIKGQFYGEEIFYHTKGYPDELMVKIDYMIPAYRTIQYNTITNEMIDHEATQDLNGIIYQKKNEKESIEKEGKSKQQLPILANDIEWLKEEVYKLEGETSHCYPQGEVVRACEVLELIDQISQPEVPVIPESVHKRMENAKPHMELGEFLEILYSKKALEGSRSLSVTEKWIMDNIGSFAYVWQTDHYTVRCDSESLDMLELPYAVAKHMEHAKTYLNLEIVFQLADTIDNSPELFGWIAENKETYKQAWETGEYTVASKESLYRVKLLPQYEGYLNRHSHGLSTATIGSTYTCQTEFTEQEIKDINPLYWLFKEKVEDENEGEE